jgi:hypothetical protein
MKPDTCFGYFLIFFFLVSLSINLLAQDNSQFKKISWLTGCWEMSESDFTVTELWMAPSGGIMIGLSQTVSDDKTSGYEFLRIEEKDGKLVYTAIPSGQTETSFYQVQLNDTMVVFENMEHDFPQRIIYTLLNKDSFNARVEATENGGLKGFDLPMKRADCTK